MRPHVIILFLLMLTITTYAADITKTGYAFFTDHPELTINGTYVCSIYDTPKIFMFEKTPIELSSKTCYNLTDTKTIKVDDKYKIEFKSYSVTVTSIENTPYCMDCYSIYKICSSDIKKPYEINFEFESNTNTIYLTNITKVIVEPYTEWVDDYVINGTELNFKCELIPNPPKDAVDNEGNPCWLPKWVPVKKLVTRYVKKDIGPTENITSPCFYVKISGTKTAKQNIDNIPVIKESKFKEFNWWNSTTALVFQINTSWGTGANFSFTLQASGRYNATVNWGDGVIQRITSHSSANRTHTYAQHGVYNITVEGEFYKYQFGASPAQDAPKMKEIMQWGMAVPHDYDLCYNCTNVIVTATDTLNTTNVSRFFRMFYYAYNLTSVPNIHTWNVENITHVNYMFGFTKFNDSLNGWNTTNLTDMYWFFGNNYVFNNSIENLNTSKVVSFAHTFREGRSFNRNISSWNTSSGVDFGAMFYRAKNFTQDISRWNMSNAANIGEMFRESNYNLSLNGWDVSNVTGYDVWTGFGMTFAYSAFINPNVSEWRPRKANVMTGMFRTSGFNYNINEWNVSTVKDMNWMFDNNQVFNQPLNKWDVRNVVNMTGMFNGSIRFNQDLSSWNISSVRNATDMFKNSNVSTTNYDLMLIAWSNLTLQPNVPFGAPKYYCAGSSARAYIISTFNWNITGDTYNCTDYAPAVTIISPVNGSSTTNITLVINITAAPNYHTIWYNWNGTNVTYTQPHNVTFPSPANITIHAWANSTLSTKVGYTNITFSTLAMPPDIYIISPTAGFYENETIEVRLSSNQTVNFTYNWNGTNVTYIAPELVKFPKGNITLRAWATNIYGVTNSTNVSFTVMGAPPQITVLYPYNGSVPTPLFVFFEANSTYLDTCWVTINGTNYTYNHTSCNNFTTFLPFGNYTATFFARDTFSRVNWTSVDFEVNSIYGSQSEEGNVIVKYQSLPMDIVFIASLAAALLSLPMLCYLGIIKFKSAITMGVVSLMLSTITLFGLNLDNVYFKYFYPLYYIAIGLYLINIIVSIPSIFTELGEKRILGGDFNEK